jgi:hypothetical protein
VLATGGKQIIGYVRPPLHAAAKSQSLQAIRARPRPSQPAASADTRHRQDTGQAGRRERETQIGCVAPHGDAASA